QTPPVARIAFGVAGGCGEPPCSGYQITFRKSNTHEYSVFPHRRIWRGRTPFIPVLQELAKTDFFSREHPPRVTTKSYPGVIDAYASWEGGSRGASVFPDEQDYRQYQSFAKNISQPVLRDVAIQQARESREMRNSRDLTAVRIAHWLPDTCAYYAAHFTPKTTELTYWSLNNDDINRPVVIALPAAFPVVRRNVAKYGIARLYEDYPTIGSFGDRLVVQLRYTKSSYTIKAYQQQFWPQSLRDFVSTVDAHVRAELERPPFGPSTGSGQAELRVTGAIKRCRNVRV
ncbi:MAG: hypothetical protein ABR584_13060, partial [Candidatus Baltobacteraceae bacterium]